MAIVPYHIVRNSKIHGRGVFARRPIRKGVRVIEYTGPIITNKEADKIAQEKSESGHSHTMLFTVDEDRVIDGTRGGDAKYINHSCEPNCEAVQDGDQIFIEALRSIKKGEEITYDYHLQVPGKLTKKVLKEYVCFCGSAHCRGSQIAIELLEKQAKKDALKKEKKEKKRLKKEMKKAQKLKKKRLKQQENKKKPGKKKDKSKASTSAAKDSSASKPAPKKTKSATRKKTGRKSMAMDRPKGPSHTAVGRKVRRIVELEKQKKVQPRRS